MNSAPAIGIDLGTTFSLAAVYRNGKSEVIPNQDGQRLIPSYVLYHPDSSDVSVGSVAKDLSPKYPENTLFDQKRLIGRKYHDAYVQTLQKSTGYKFKIVKGEEGKAEIELIYNRQKKHKSPEQACSEILTYIRKYSSEYLGADVTEAVISVPAHFSSAQRKATRSAAELAGFKVLKLITEPVAGAIHFAQDRLNTEGNLLVFDFGGGTLDVSIITVNKKAFEVKSVEGDTFLGGRDFDQKIVEYFMNDVIKIFKEQTVDRLTDRIRRNCIKIKQKLSTTNKYDLPLEYITENRSREHTLSMTRSEFEELTKELSTRSLKLVEKCLKGAGLAAEDISEVVLVGGTTRIPKLREQIRSYFKNKELRTDLNPDEAVALGAAVQAALLQDDLISLLEKFKITEVAPLSIGLGMDGNLMNFAIKKNSPLPFKSQPIKTVTIENDQTSCLFSIYEGERKNCEYNNLLGSFSVENIPIGKAGEIKFESIYSLNEDGILEVEAFETTTGLRNKLVVTLGEYRLCENKIKSAVDDSASNSLEDDKFEEFTIYKRTVKKLCYHILYYLRTISPSTERTKLVEQKCKLFINSLQHLDYTELKKLRENYRNFREAVTPVVKQYNIKVDIAEEKTVMAFVLDEIMDRNNTLQENANSWSRMASSTSE